jgi:hypothetical protein
MAIKLSLLEKRREVQVFLFWNKPLNSVFPYIPSHTVSLFVNGGAFKEEDGTDGLPMKFSN